MGLLTVSVSESESSVLVSVAGEVDITVSGQLGESLAVLAGARYLVVDVSGLKFIDVAGVRVLVGVCEAAKDAGGSLALVSPQPVVARMLELCQADQLIAVYGGSAPVTTPARTPSAREATVPRPRSEPKYPAAAG